MRRILLHRLGVLVPTVVLASFIVFVLVHLVPGDPAVAIAGEQASTEQLASLRDQLGLNDSLVVQYWHWLGKVIHFDLGRSVTSQQSVTHSIAQTLPITLEIVVAAMLISVVIGVPLGVLGARRANSAADQIVTTASSVGIAVPSFWLGLILVSQFALTRHWLPATGFVRLTEDPIDSVRHVILPGIAVGIAGAAEIARQLRAVMIDALSSDYVRTLRAKGLRTRSIVWRHALKNSSVSLVTIIGLQVNRFLGATVVVEAVFGIGGLGTLVVNATQKHDYPTVQGVVLMMVVIVIAVNLVVDISYRLIDPRIRS
jgi:peptide/nickel transport system permease protein